jgi:hypothetical protein
MNSAVRGYQRIASPFLEIETPDKANAIFIAQQNLEMNDSHPDYPALVMAGYMIGVGGGISGHPLDPVGSFSAFAIYAPENAAALETACVEELEKALADGFIDEELTLDEVNAAIRRHLDISKITIVKAGDFAGAQERIGIP